MVLEYKNHFYFVDFTFIAGRKGIKTTNNGDPGWPDDDDEVYINDVYLNRKKFRRIPEKMKAYFIDRILRY